MAKRYPYNPLTQPHPKQWFNGWASKAQRRHFMKSPRLQKYIGGMNWWTPKRGHGNISDKMKPLPNRLHPKKRKLR